MSNTDDYTQKLEALQAISPDDVKDPNIPVDVYTQESENLYQWCQADKNQLTAAGLDSALFEDLPVRAGACRQAQSVWVSERRSQQDAAKEWREKSPAAFDLRDQLLHSLTYAYRNDASLLGRLAEIRDGNGNADMVQDLNDLAVLGKSHTDELNAIKFDLTLLDTAATTSDEMDTLLATANGTKGEINEAKDMRDRAYTYLKQAVDEIRQCGQYVFWRDERRMKGYISAYQHKLNAKRAASPKAETPKS